MSSDKEILKTLSELLRQLYEVEATVGDFTQPNSQELLLSRLQEFMQGVQQFKERAATYTNMQVPTALYKFIDDGGHPDDFVRMTFRTAVSDNQLAAGRVAAVQAMRDELLAQATAAYPEAAAVYNSVVEAKQQQQQQAVEEAPAPAAVGGSTS